MNPRTQPRCIRPRTERFGAALLATLFLFGGVLSPRAHAQGSARSTVAVAASSAPSAASAPSPTAPTPAPTTTIDKAACVAASDQGQSLRNDKKMKEARRAFLTCSQEACPAVVRTDCAQWLAQVDDSIPTIVVVAHDGAGNDVVKVRVIVDGEIAAESLTGDALSVNPGPHHLRLEGPDGFVVERDVLVREGEKNRGVTVTFGAPPPAPLATAASSTTASTAPPPRSTGPSPVAYVLGGVGVVALGSFAYFGLKGRSDVSHLRDTCGIYCASSDIQAAHTKLYVADGSLVVGIGALAVATYLFLHTPHDDAPAAHAARSTDLRLDAAPVSGGGVAFLSGRF